MAKKTATKRKTTGKTASKKPAASTAKKPAANKTPEKVEQKEVKAPEKPTPVKKTDKKVDYRKLIKTGFKFRNSDYEYEVICIEKQSQTVIADVDCNSGNYQTGFKMEKLLQGLDNGLLEQVK